MKTAVIMLTCVTTLSALAAAQAPEVIHYTFDTGDATNTAVPGVGNGIVQAGVNFAPSVVCSAGQAAVSSGTSPVQIDSGWQMDLGTTDWSIGMHLDFTAGSSGFQYYFGSSSAGGFRAFSGGAAGTDGLLLRTTMGGDVTIPNAAPTGGTSHVVFVHDASVPEVRGYLDGILIISEPQSSPGTGVVGSSADFEVMTYTADMLAGVAMDDFRLYRRALSDAEIGAWANCGGGQNFPTFCDPADNNSTGVPTRISGSTGSGIGADLHLEATQGPPNEFGYFLIGTAIADPGLAISQGHLCLSFTGSNAFGRYNVIGGNLNSVGQFDSSGILQNAVGTSTVGTGFDVPITVPITGSPMIMSGETWHFQLWYRESGGNSNFSNGLSATF